MQFILDENEELQEISKDKCRPVEYAIKYKSKNTFSLEVSYVGKPSKYVNSFQFA